MMSGRGGGSAYNLNLLQNNNNNEKRNNPTRKESTE